jgi:hypothetical protein
MEFQVLTIIKYTVSGGLFGLSLAYAVSGDSLWKFPVATSLFFLLILYLASLEGCQVAFVGLQSINTAIYSEEHTLTAISIRKLQTDSNIERFIMGRQFLTVAVVFLINFVGSSAECSLHTPAELSVLFCNGGLGVMFVTILMGQVVSQIIAAVHMLDFTNNYIAVLNAYLSLGIEYSGALHVVHAFRMIVDKVTHSTNNSSLRVVANHPAKDFFLWIRVVFSSLLLM